MRNPNTTALKDKIEEQTKHMSEKMSFQRARVDLAEYMGLLCVS